MTRVGMNERSWVISLISDLNQITERLSLKVKKVGGENTVNTGTKRMFPDVILFGDSDQTQILQGWEIKLPDVLITDETFINDAQRKANILNLNSCFIWNFSCGVLYKKDLTGDFKIVKVWNDTNYIQSRNDVKTYHTEWLTVLQKILLEINAFFISGEFKSAGLEDIITDTILTTIITRNKYLVATSLHDASITNTRIESKLSVWWKEVKTEYYKDESNMYSAYSKTILLNWTNRILFAHLIKSFHNQAYMIDTIDQSTTVENADKTIRKISEECDFYHIFNSLEFFDLIPADTWTDLVEFSLFLKSNGVTKIDQTALQSTLENSINSSKRELAGQFTTPQNLADLLVRLTMTNLYSNVIDPCCGTGSIPKAAISLKKKVISITDSMNSTWSSDKFSFPLQIANIALTSKETINIPARIFQSNVFKVINGMTVKITNPVNGQMMSIAVPEFDVVVSNLPFVPFEIIESDEKAYLEEIIGKVRLDTGIEIDNRSDLYIFIIIFLWRIIKTNGRVGVITSNAWLGTDAGKKFYSIIRYYYNVEGIYISGGDRWFKNADVITTITVLNKKEIGNPSKENETIFGLINKPVESFSVTEIMDTIIQSALLKQEIDKNTIGVKVYKQLDIDDLLELNISLNSLFHDVNWLLKVKSKLTKVTEIFEVIRGERRGWDQLFYPEAGHGIEQEYIKRVLKNSRGTRRLVGKADADAFCCSHSKDQLIALGHTGALKWIEKFEACKNGTGIALPIVLARSNHYWYEMKDDAVVDMYTGMNPDRRLFYARFEQPSFINQRLIGFTKKDLSLDINICHALMNSMIGMFYIEGVGFGRGLGALDINSRNLGNSFMLDPRLLNSELISKILESFLPIMNRDILTTEEEMIQIDRIEFEHTVLKAFGIDQYYDQILNSLLSIQRTRLSVITER